MTDLLDLSFDLYSRHRLAQRVADYARLTQGATSLRVLDVGGYPCFMPQFLPNDQVVVADIVEPTGQRPAARYLRADGTALPFGDASFNMVVSLDSLEHVQHEKRAAYVADLLRCSDDLVLIVAPFAQETTALADRLLAEFVRVFDQEESPQLLEHQAHGLPELDEWLAFVRDAGAECVSFSSGFIYNWLPMMLLKYYLVSLPDTLDLHHALDRFYNVTLQKSDARAPGYRQCILASKRQNGSVLTTIAKEMEVGEPPDRLEVMERLTQIDLLLKVADLHVKWRRDEALREDVLAKEHHIRNVEAALESERSRVRALEAHLDAIQRGRVMQTLNALNRVVRRSR